MLRDKEKIYTQDMTQDMHVYGFKKRATSKMNRSTHTLSILLEQLRSSLGAGKEQPRRSLGYAYSEVTARRQRDYGLSLTRLRLVIITLLALMIFGATNALGQTPFTLSTADDVTNGTEKLYWMESYAAEGFYMIAHTNNLLLIGMILFF